MWSYDSTKNRELRVRSVVERSMREGLGAEEVVLRRDLLDYAVVVAPRDDFASILTSELDLKASPEDGTLTMAEALSSIGSDGRGREEALDRSLASGILSDGGGSEEMVADLPENSSAGSALIGAPVKMVADGEELQMSTEGSGMVLSDQSLSVSTPSSFRVAGLQGDVSEVRGRGAVVGQPTVVSALSDSDGGQATGRLGDVLADASSVDDMLPAGSVFPFADSGVDSVCPIDDIEGGPVPFLDVQACCAGVGGLVREEARAPPTAQEALRPQPADGLWQLPRPSEEPMPVSVVEAATGTKAKEDLVAATHAVEPFGLRVEVRMALVSRAGRQLQRYNPNGHHLVVGCIPYRYKGSCKNGTEVEVLVISSQKARGKGIMFPKGGWELDESVEEAAHRESLEEAGVLSSLEVQEDPAVACSSNKQVKMLLQFAMLTWRRPRLVSGLSLRIHQRHYLAMVALQLQGSSLYHSFPNSKMKFATLCFSVRVLSF
ncbi:hypothetical protein Dimus_024710 [Dionaea muscipula]